MKTHVIVNLFAVLVFSALAGVAYGVTKIAPTQAEAGHPSTIIDTQQRRLIGGSVAVFRLGGLEVVLPGRTHKPYNTMQSRITPDMFGGNYTVFVRQPDVNEKDSDGLTPLHLAALGGHEKVVSRLLAKGADPEMGLALIKVVLHGALCMTVLIFTQTET